MTTITPYPDSSSPYYTLPHPEPVQKRSTLPTIDPFEISPDDLVHQALSKLANAGIQMILWGALLDKYLNVPRAVVDCSFLIPDEQLETASDILSDMQLPMVPPNKLLSKTEGEFHTKGYRHRVSRSTSPSSLICMHLYPASFVSYNALELSPADFKDYKLLVPRPSAIYASILRMMAKYPRSAPERRHLYSDLDLLIHYNLMDIQGGYVDDDDWEELGVRQKIDNAVSTVRSWGLLDEWREGEEWMPDALTSILQGTNDMEQLPWYTAG